MRYNQIGTKRLLDRIVAAQTYSGLNGWEMEFLASIQARIEASGSESNLSARQHHRLEQIFDKAMPA